MQSWQVFHFARKYLGRSALYVIFGKKNGRAVEYWCEDPKTTDKPSGAYDPIQGVKNLLTALDDQGHCGVVRSCLEYLAAGTSAGCGQRPEIIEPLPTVNEEILADYSAVGEMHRAIAGDATPHTVLALKNEAIAEIERTYAKYRAGFAS